MKTSETRKKCLADKARLEMELNENRQVSRLESESRITRMREEKERIRLEKQRMEQDFLD